MVHGWQSKLEGFEEGHSNVGKGIMSQHQEQIEISFAFSVLVLSPPHSVVTAHVNASVWISGLSVFWVFPHYPHGVYFIRINHKSNGCCVIMWVTDFPLPSLEKDLAFHLSKRLCSALQRLSCEMLQKTQMAGLCIQTQWPASTYRVCKRHHCLLMMQQGTVYLLFDLPV